MKREAEAERKRRDKIMKMHADGWSCTQIAEHFEVTYQAVRQMIRRALHPKAPITSKPETLCWSCTKATGFCQWSKYKVQQPIAGWEAIKTPMRVRQENGKPVYADSYIVLDCPEYEHDGVSEDCVMNPAQVARFLQRIKEAKT